MIKIYNYIITKIAYYWYIVQDVDYANNLYALSKKYRNLV